MKFKNITLNNFRSFYDKQKIEFAADDNKKITIIHAENHTGKQTSLTLSGGAFMER